MAKRTISLPDDLDRRMDRVKETVNWSAVAAQAFELKLGELAERRKEKTMDNVIERLRASKVKHVSGRVMEGYDLGADWAKGQAEFDELRRLSDMNADETIIGTPMAPYSHADYLAFDVLGTGEDDRDHHVSRDFWNKAIGDSDDARLESEDFLRGFMEGAQSVYRSVADKI
jgi:hypothetical protein